MSHRVEILCRPELAAGFALAGFRPWEAETAGDALVRVRKLLAQPDIGVILLEEDLFRKLDEETRRHIAANPLPLIVPFPSPRWEAPTGPDQYIVDLLRHAIGYRVRLT